MDWLTEMVERYGVIRIVLGVVVSAAGAITGLAAALGGGAVGVSWVLAGLLFLSLLFIAALVVSLRRQHQQEQMLRWALGSLRQYIHATSRLVSETLLEREEIHINRRGDGTWRGILTERVAPASPSPLHFIRWDLGGESLREREQRKMQFSVRALPGGGRLPFEVEWTSNRDVILWVHPCGANSTGGSDNH